MRLLTPFLVAVIGWLVVATSGADARDVVATNFNAPSVDLSSVIEYLETSEKEIVVPVPTEGEGTPTAMTVTAKGPGDVHRFAVVTLYNEEPLPREMVLVSRWPGFVGSGLIWPHFDGTQILTVQAAPGLPPKRLSETQSDTYSLTLDPGSTVTVVAELVGDQVSNLSLWHKVAYDKQQQQLSFFRGVVLGIATLTAVFMVCLFIIRLQPAFPSAALFAFASVFFIALEFGYLPVLQPLLPTATGLEVRVRAVIEALMATGALACLLTFLELRRRSPVIGYPVMGALVGSLLIAACAWFAPAICMGLARILLLLTTVGGFALIIVLWRQGMIRAQASLVTWCFLLLWTLCWIAAALGWFNLEVVSPVLAWGLVLVLLTMAFTLTQFAFNQGVVNSRFFEDSGRRGLALAGAEQVIWDWHEENGTLFVGPELERVLGHPQGRITRGGLKGWLELIHPNDRADYVGVVEAAVQRGRGTFSHQFRLRRGDGTYRWFQLKARSLPGDLGRAVRCIGTLADITAAKRSEEQLLADSVRDRITGLPYEALFMDRLERALQQADAQGNDNLYVLIVDLDRFKHVNESLGFAVGDSLLLTIARRLSSLIGPEDTLARLHGDRFGIILNLERPERNLDAFVEQLRKLVTRPVPLKPQEVFLTACLGIVRYMRDKTRPTQLLKDAETALYRAKKQGKYALVIFTEDMREGAPSLVNLEDSLRQALERQQIEIAYQPVMRLDNRRLAGFEALVRWRHPEYGLLEPADFMRLAEDLGLMNEFGRFVLSQSARQLGIWQRAYRSDEPLFMTVNVSSRELINRDLVDEVKTVLAREDLVPGTLRLELTETILMENPELSIKILEKLQQAGVGIACDDFGTGYSALSHLRRLPFDTIKIDRSFLEDEADDEAAQIILEAIVLLAHDLGMTTVAEGIETSDQADRLRELGCDYGQGFLFGEPMTARQVMEAFGGSQSISSRKTRPAVGFWQKVVRRGDEAGEPAESRKGDRKPAKAVTHSAGFDPEKLAQAEAEAADRAAMQPVIEPVEDIALAGARATLPQNEATAAVSTAEPEGLMRTEDVRPASTAMPVRSAPATGQPAAPAVQAAEPAAPTGPAPMLGEGAGLVGPQSPVESANAAAAARATTTAARVAGAGAAAPAGAQAMTQPRSGQPPLRVAPGQAVRHAREGQPVQGDNGPRPVAVRMPLAQRGPVMAPGSREVRGDEAGSRPAPAAAIHGAAPAPTGSPAAATGQAPDSPATVQGAPQAAGAGIAPGSGTAQRPQPERRAIPTPTGIGGRIPGALPPGPMGPLRGHGLGQHGRAGYLPAALAGATRGLDRTTAAPATEIKSGEAGPAVQPPAATDADAQGLQQAAIHEAEQAAEPIPSPVAAAASTEAIDLPADDVAVDSNPPGAAPAMAEASKDAASAEDAGPDRDMQQSDPDPVVAATVSHEDSTGTEAEPVRDVAAETDHADEAADATTVGHQAAGESAAEETMADAAVVEPVSAPVADPVATHVASHAEEPATDAVAGEAGTDAIAEGRIDVPVVDASVIAEEQEMPAVADKPESDHAVEAAAAAVEAVAAGSEPEPGASDLPGVPEGEAVGESAAEVSGNDGKTAVEPTAPEAEGEAMTAPASEVPGEELPVTPMVEPAPAEHQVAVLGDLLRGTGPLPGLNGSGTASGVAAASTAGQVPDAPVPASEPAPTRKAGTVLSDPGGEGLPHDPAGRGLGLSPPPRNGGPHGAPRPQPPLRRRLRKTTDRPVDLP